MNNNFVNKSKKNLLGMLKEPGGFSFFPSPIFWGKNLVSEDIRESYKSFFSGVDSKINNPETKVNLYVHIPFCSRICSYCNCFKKQLITAGEIDTYIGYLEKEIKLISELNENKKISVNTIFVGGGTPNILSVASFKKLYGLIEEYFDLSMLEDFLLDGHPNYYTKEKLDYFSLIGVKRLTYAVQSFDSDVLEINNRDCYDLSKLEENIAYTNKLDIAINIDLLVGLKGQDFASIKRDIDYIHTLGVNNVSVHYLMNSSNIKYSVGEGFHSIVDQTKEYLDDNPLPCNSSNKGEDYFASSRNTTLSLGASAVTNIYSGLIYIKPHISTYYKQLDSHSFPHNKGMKISKNDEMIKYIYLNILHGLSMNTFTLIYGEDLFKSFFVEMSFLHKNGIIGLQGDRVYPLKSDLETLIYFNIFFVKTLREFEGLRLSSGSLDEFFLPGGELIDK